MSRSSALILLLCFMSSVIISQSVMTPELLWKLGRVSGQEVTSDGSVIFSVRHYNASDNSSSSSSYSLDIQSGVTTPYDVEKDKISATHVNAAGQKLIHKSVKLEKVTGKDRYPELEQSNVLIYDDLMYRHWDTWHDGTFDHVFIVDQQGNDTDIMEGQKWHCPTKPFGGSDDYLWHPNGEEVILVTKRKSGVDYTISTNTDILSYNVKSGDITNLSENMPGYDTHPAFSPAGELAWLSMATDGYESDKNDIVVYRTDGTPVNLTAHWDGTVFSFRWDDEKNLIYFIAPINGTRQLFSVDYPAMLMKVPDIKQITNGPFDVTGIVGQHGDQLVVSRTDMNHATELYRVELNSGEMHQLTHVNDSIYNSISLSPIEKRMVTTTDDKEMVTWVIYPPNFDPSKKYPTLLYCQGGPQGALSQFYSFRWNFQIMAAQGYIIIAPNRRGMPGYGVEWNKQISKDYGGQNMRDYLSAIDALSKENYVDNERLGAVGASYGGYSVFYLAGIHENRFKSFISHDGIFNLRSMYGTTEELFFVNYDLGGNYWDVKNHVAQKSYSMFSPINFVHKWNTPILIFQGGKDYRVPDGQSLEAFQAAQLQGIKSRLIYLPDENHWVLSAQNGLVWQREFFRWLEETL